LLDDFQQLYALHLRNDSELIRASDLL